MRALKFLGNFNFVLIGTKNIEAIFLVKLLIIIPNTVCSKLHTQQYAIGSIHDTKIQMPPFTNDY